jgi:pimeloyl-ACP methyl ester carboxylesterase
VTRWPRLHAAAAVVLALFLVVLATSSRPPRPAPALRAAYVDAGALRIRYARAGRGRPVVLLHGYGESLVAWRGVFDRLARGADVIAIDLPGFGLSAKPSSGYATDSLALTVIRVLDALGVSRASLVGHSLGGAIAAAVALRDSTRVDRLVLIDAALVGVPAALPDSSGIGSDASRKAITSYEAMRTRFTPPHDPNWLAEDPADAAYLPAGDAAYRTSLASVLTEFDFAWLTRARADQLRLPTLILWGEYDTVFPLSSGRLLAAALPAARFEVIPRAWHRPHVERPGPTGDLVASFLGVPRVGAIPPNP